MISPHRIRSLIAVILALWVMSAIQAHAQVSAIDSSRLARQRMNPRIGFFFGGGVVYHGSNFAGIPESPTCLLCDSGAFSGGIGGGIFGGALLLELPIDQVWRVQAHGGYYSVGARQTVQRDIGPIALAGEDTATGVSEYTLNTPFGMVGGGIALGFRPFSMPLTFRLGPEIGVIVARPFDQQEELIAPASGVFIGPGGERTQVRNAYTGELDQPDVQIGAQVQIDYDLPLNKYETMLFTPELSYTFPLTRVRSDLDWRIHQVRAGVALKYSLPVPEHPSEPKEILPPLPPQSEPVLAGEFRALSFARGKEVDGLRVTVEEFVSVQMRSLLPYIFFDDGSSEIPERYARLESDEADGFGLSRLHNRSTLDVYHQMLNTIGLRMRENPTARLTLIGANSDRGEEAGDISLSRARAERVKEYLVDVWSIASERIATAARNLPVTPSNPDDPDGIAENRRVEIVSTMPEILAPVTTADTVRLVDPPTLRMKNTTRADAGISAWRIAVGQGEKTLKEFAGGGTIPSVVDWNMAADDGTIPVGEKPLHAVLSVRDGRGKDLALHDTVDVEWISIRRKREERLGDTIFHRYNLITFDFDRANLTPATMRIIDMVRERTQPGSIVEIAGYTDRVGDEAHNRDLSRLRAVNTARALGVPAEQAIGLGESVTRFDNDLPEGRFLSRSVDITVKAAITGE